MSIAAIVAQQQASPAVVATPLVNALVATGAAIAVFAWVWRAEREAWLGWLIATWVLWAMRYAVALTPLITLTIGSGVLGSPIGTPLFFARDAAFTMMLFYLGARWSIRLWLALLVPLLFVSTGLPGSHAIQPWANAYAYASHGVLWVAGAMHVGSSTRLHGRIRLLVAAGFVVHAVVIGVSSWASRWAPWAIVSLSLSSVVHLSVALGVGIGVHMRLLADRESAELRVSRSLEFVVRGVVPMCAHCRSVRGPDGGWTTLDDFVAQRTETPVVDTRCPDCASRVAQIGHRPQAVMTP